MGEPQRSKPGDADGTLARPAIGLEAEFSLRVDGRLRPVEQVFKDPTDFIDAPLVHRVGSSYHLPTGGAVYFDTGVIEVATPPIEISRGCAVQAARSLWDSIQFVRDHLTAWERRTSRTADLIGFSTHYNVSFEHAGEPGSGRTTDDLARLLAYVLPVPVMVLATNRASTGVGVRPRASRVEMTVDFTPDAALMVSTAAFVTGAIRQIVRWPSFDLDMLERHRVPVIEGFAPIPHTSRRGWLARFDCYPDNPFLIGADERRWPTRHVRRDGRTGTLSLRQIARRMFRLFRQSIARVADAFTLRLIDAVLQGRESSLLDMDERPASYENVGRLCSWNDGMGKSAPGRSAYERVLMRAVSGARLRIGPHVLRPVGMSGWSRVVFEREHGGVRHALSLDVLLPHLDEWEDER
jgi:hypothetical protein